jgi:polysaccharide export outer membrane protein
MIRSELRLTPSRRFFRIGRYAVSHSERRNLTLAVIASVGLSLFPGTALADDQISEPPLRDISTDYLLGPQDQLAIRITELDESSNAPLRIDPAGNIDLPLVGPLHAAGLTLSDLRTQLTQKFSKYIREPKISVSVLEFHSQPVTVVGQVKSPGIHQIEGPKRLLEIISMAGGLTEGAGSTVTITRELGSGPLPLPEARTDLSAKVTIAQMELAGLIDGRNPSRNILIRPNDVISISTADLIYVVGEVKKPGGFTLHSHTTVTLLEAIGMADGLEKSASPSNARVLRLSGEGTNRAEIRADISKIINGKSPDIRLQSNDILIVPNNVPRAASLRALEAAIQMGTGILIYHGLR